MRRDRRASVLTTLVFTDIVASTAIAEEMGDRRWHDQLFARLRRDRDVPVEPARQGPGVIAVSAASYDW